MWKNGNGGKRRRVPLSDLTNCISTTTRPNPLPFNACGTVGLEVSEPISSKNQKKAAIPIPRISNIRDKSNGAQGLNLPKAKPLTLPCRKKQRVVSCEQDASKDAQLQDFIEKQKAYFKEIDEFKLAEEEVESIDELD